MNPMRILSIIWILIIGHPSVAQDDTVYVTTPQTFSLCYGDGMDSSVAYITTTIYPLAIKFCSGEMETCCDEVWVYDGADNTAPLLYVGNGDEGDLSGVFVISTGPAVYLEIRSDDTVSCATAQYEPLTWVVDTFWYDLSDCQFLGMDEDRGGRPVIAPNPADDMLNIWTWTSSGDVRIDLRDLSGRVVPSKASSTDGGWKVDTSHLADGQYTISVSDGDRAAVLRALIIH